MDFMKPNNIQLNHLTIITFIHRIMAVVPMSSQASEVLTSGSILTITSSLFIGAGNPVEGEKNQSPRPSPLLRILGIGEFGEAAAVVPVDQPCGL